MWRNVDDDEFGYGRFFQQVRDVCIHDISVALWGVGEKFSHSLHIFDKEIYSDLPDLDSYHIQQLLDEKGREFAQELILAFDPFSDFEFVDRVLHDGNHVFGA